jgi:hypothetical protein
VNLKVRVWFEGQPSSGGAWLPEEALLWILEGHLPVLNHGGKRLTGKARDSSASGSSAWLGCLALAPAIYRDMREIFFYIKGLYLT